MGVKRLYNILVNDRGGAGIKTDVEDGRQLVIDGSGLAHYLARDDRNDLGGDYGRLEALVESTLHQLVKLRKFRVTIYKDGPHRRMKGRTREERLAQRREEWLALEDWANHSSNRLTPTAQFPVPVLLMKTFYRAVKKFDTCVTVLECPEEADIELARSGHLVLAEDSDFLLFKNCEYMPLHELEKLCRNETVRIWTRAEAARVLHLREHQFIEFALMLGNDYVSSKEVLTALLDEEQTQANSDEKEEKEPQEEKAKRPKAKVIRSPHLLLEWLRDHPDFMLPDTIQGVAYSRALYQLEPIDHFPLDAPTLEKTQKQKSDGSPSILPETEEDDNLGLTRAGEYVLATVAQRLETTPSHTDKTSYLSRLLSTPDFQAEYAAALAESLKILPHPISEHRAMPEKPASFADVVAFYRYQLCVEHDFFFHAASSSSSASPPPPPKTIAALFDGPSFHAALERQRSVLADDSDTDSAWGDMISEDGSVKAENHAPIDPTVLPIDAHQDEILDHVARNRITIVVGETGSGKSSRLPVMLMESDPKARMFVSQPRRIAAKSLCERVKSQVSDPDQIGLRLGHGERKETKKTRLWFCTTGYLVRLVASCSRVLLHHTHLVIDEVHERTVDTEVLCLLARRLVESHPTIRLILMSATLCTELLAGYFQTTEPHVFVGVRRFENCIYYADDLIENLGGFPRHVHAIAQKVVRATEPIGHRSDERVSSAVNAAQYDLVVALINRIGSGDSSILVFVAGMNDIVELSERILRLNPPALTRKGRKPRTFLTLAIHSEVPYEEQAKVFEKNTDPMTVRIILATNAAESSLTIPDLDHVIDLGIAKEIQYNEASHRQVLQTSWISKSSVTQRSGRTGRVRPGTVYRLYAFNRFSWMHDHDTSEIQRTPLDAVVLNFYSMLASSELNDSVSSLLGETMEPPSHRAVSRAFDSLFSDGLLDDPSDQGTPTPMGTFVSILGIDLSLGRLVGLGAQLGLLSDAITLASILSQTHSPWRIANPLVHDDPEEYNAIVRTTYSSRLQFDAGTRSEPIAILRLLEEYESIPREKKHQFIYKNGLAASRMNQLVAHSHHLKRRVAAALNLQNQDAVDENVFHKGNKTMKKDVAKDKKRLNRLRLLLTWTARDSLFELEKVASGSSISISTDGTLRCKVQGPLLTPEHIDALSIPAPVSTCGGIRRQYRADNVLPFLSNEMNGAPAVNDITGKRAKKKMNALTNASNETYLWTVLEARLLNISFGPDAPSGIECAWIIITHRSGSVTATMYATEAGAKLGHDMIQRVLTHGTREKAGENLIKISTPALAKSLKKAIHDLCDRMPCFGISLAPDGKLDCIVADVDIQPSLHLALLLDLRPFDSALPRFKKHDLPAKQYLSFRPSDDDDTPKSPEGWRDMPLGARYLSAIAGGYRETMVRLWADPKDKERGTLDFKVSIPQPKYVCCYGDRAGRKIFCAEHTLAKTDVNLAAVGGRNSNIQFGVAATMLDIESALARASGVTLLPSGSLWLDRALASFGDRLTIQRLPEWDQRVIERINTVAISAAESVKHVPELTALLDDLFFPPNEFFDTDAISDDEAPFQKARTTPSPPPLKDATIVTPAQKSMLVPPVEEVIPSNENRTTTAPIEKAIPVPALEHNAIATGADEVTTVPSANEKMAVSPIHGDVSASFAEEILTLPSVGIKAIQPAVEEGLTVPSAENDANEPPAEEAMNFPIGEDESSERSTVECITVPPVETDVSEPPAEKAMTLPTVEDGSSEPSAVEGITVENDASESLAEKAMTIPTLEANSSERSPVEGITVSPPDTNVSEIPGEKNMTLPSADDDKSASFADKATTEVPIEESTAVSLVVQSTIAPVLVTETTVAPSAEENTIVIAATNTESPEAPKRRKENKKRWPASKGATTEEQDVLNNTTTTNGNLSDSKLSPSHRAALRALTHCQESSVNGDAATPSYANDAANHNRKRNNNRKKTTVSAPAQGDLSTDKATSNTVSFRDLLSPQQRAASETITQRLEAFVARSADEAPKNNKAKQKKKASAQTPQPEALPQAAADSCANGQGKRSKKVPAETPQPEALPHAAADVRDNGKSKRKKKVSAQIPQTETIIQAAADACDSGKAERSEKLPTSSPQPEALPQAAADSCANGQGKRSKKVPAETPQPEALPHAAADVRDNGKSKRKKKVSAQIPQPEAIIQVAVDACDSGKAERSEKLPTSSPQPESLPQAAADSCANGQGKPSMKALAPTPQPEALPQAATDAGDSGKTKRSRKVPTPSSQPEAILQATADAPEIGKAKQKKKSSAPSSRPEAPAQIVAADVPETGKAKQKKKSSAPTPQPEATPQAATDARDSGKTKRSRKVPTPSSQPEAILQATADAPEIGKAKQKKKSSAPSSRPEAAAQIVAADVPETGKAKQKKKSSAPTPQPEATPQATTDASDSGKTKRSKKVPTPSPQDKAPAQIVATDTPENVKAKHNKKVPASTIHPESPLPDAADDAPDNIKANNNKKVSARAPQPQAPLPDAAVITGANGRSGSARRRRISAPEATVQAPQPEISLHDVATTTPADSIQKRRERPRKTTQSTEQKASSNGYAATGNAVIRDMNKQNNKASSPSLQVSQQQQEGPSAEDIVIGIDGGTGHEKKRPKADNRKRKKAAAPSPPVQDTLTHDAPSLTSPGGKGKQLQRSKASSRRSVLQQPQQRQQQQESPSSSVTPNVTASTNVVSGGDVGDNGSKVRKNKDRASRRNGRKNSQQNIPVPAQPATRGIDDTL